MSDSPVVRSHEGRPERVEVRRKKPRDRSVFETLRQQRYDRAEDRDAALRRLRVLAVLLDAQFTVPGTGFRFGMDAVVGLIPGVGDAVMALVSLYIVEEARRLGVPKRRLARMLANVGIDFVAGSVPVVGDLFDAAFKANLRNIRLVERSLRE